VVPRDKSTCQFCARKLSPSQTTIDHLIPKAQGGITSFTNCVVSCQTCNNKKGSKTLEQAGMTLIKTPVVPNFFFRDLKEPLVWHQDWDNFINSESIF